MSNYQKRQQESFMQKHQVDTHNGMDADFSSYKDCLSRQIAEGVHIRRCDKEMLKKYGGVAPTSTMESQE